LSFNITIQTMKNTFVAILAMAVLWSCKEDVNKTVIDANNDNAIKTEKTEMQTNLDKYVSVKLTSDLSALTENERKMLPILIKAADKMNALFAYEAWGCQQTIGNDRG